MLCLRSKFIGSKSSCSGKRQMSRQLNNKRVGAGYVVRVGAARRKRQSSQDGRRDEHAITSCSLDSMSERTVGTPRKRGHQHHPRNHGTRKKHTNPTDNNTNNKIQYSNFGIDAAQDIQVRKLPAVINTEVNNQIVNNKNYCDNKTKVSASIISDNRVDQNVNNLDNSSSKLNNNDDQITSSIRDNNNTIDLTQDCDDSISKQNNSSSSGIKKYKKPSKDYKDIPRPQAEGSSQSDAENEDPEQEEWASLRCTSESAEAVAEREARRRNRRCADYPGLAFGSSIFSSDTMMKFSVIRNELYNIMNTQLKRVCTPKKQPKIIYIFLMFI